MADILIVEDDEAIADLIRMNLCAENYHCVCAYSRKQHGAGLGLALADRIARIHGCELTFESREGQGTKVSFSLVCEKDDNDDKFA